MLVADQKAPAQNTESQSGKENHTSAAGEAGSERTQKDNRRKNCSLGLICLSAVARDRAGRLHQNLVRI
jgi:hypothetical protein